MNDPIGRLLAGLDAARVGYSAEDLSDALWLARRRGTGLEGPFTREKLPQQVDPTRESQAPATEPPSPPLSPTAPLPDAPQTAGIYLPAAGAKATAPGTPVEIPGPDPLPGSAQLVRALRPILRRGPSRTRVEFDEAETVRRIAEERLWDPALRPALDRWVRLSIVIDASRSMAVWRAASWAFVRTLQGSTAFAAVQVWWWDTEASPPRLNRARRGARVGAPAADTAVTRGTGRGTLVLVVTDCGSTGWRSGAAPHALARWARRAHVALVQPLPEAAWPVTALGSAAPVWIDMNSFLPPNTEVAVERTDAYLYFDPRRGRNGLAPAIPVVSLDPGTRPLARWARAAAGEGVDPVPGVAWKAHEPATPATGTIPRAASAPTGPVASASSAETSRSEVERFLRVASPEAQRLGRLLAAAPVITLPVLRLIRSRLVPGGRQFHEAEVLMAGWLRPETTLTPTGDSNPIEPDLVRYAIAPKDRSVLLQALPATAALDLLRTLSDHVSAQLPNAYNFAAMLSDPTGSPGALAPSEDPVAQVTAETLRHIGGAYGRLVRTRGEVSRNRPGRQPPLRPDHTAPLYFERLGIPELWDEGLTGDGVLIGHFLDLDPNHPRLSRDSDWLIQPKSSDNLAFLAHYEHASRQAEAPPTPTSSREIGTNTAILLVGQPDTGVAHGIAPRARLVSARLRDPSFGVTEILEAVDWMIGQTGLRLIDMNLGLRTHSEPLVNLVRRVEDELHILTICSVGNEGPNTVRSPADDPRTFSVGAINPSDTVSTFSSFKSDPTSGPLAPTVVAPGELINNYAPTRRTQKADPWSGTSASATLITGLAALLLEAVPEATVDQLKTALIRSCHRSDTMPRDQAGHGVPNGPRALKTLRKLVQENTPTQAATGTPPAVEGEPFGTLRELVSLRGHARDVNVVCFSPHGHTLASAGEDEIVRLWDVDSGAELGSGMGLTSSISTLAFGRDGRYLASAGDAGVIRIWHVSTGQVISSFHGNVRNVTSVSFSPDSSELASAGGDFTVRLWDPESGSQRAVLEGHLGYVRSVTFNLGGFLASGGDDGTIHLWDVHRRTTVRVFRGHDRPVWGVAFAPDGNRIASADIDGKIQVWNIPNESPVATFRTPYSGTRALSFDPVGRLLAVAGSDDMIRIWDTETRTLRARFKGHDSKTLSVAFSPDGRTLASSGGDGVVRIWDLGELAAPGATTPSQSVLKPRTPAADEPATVRAKSRKEAPRKDPASKRSDSSKRSPQGSSPKTSSTPSSKATRPTKKASAPSRPSSPKASSSPRATLGRLLRSVMHTLGRHGRRALGLSESEESQLNELVELGLVELIPGDPPRYVLTPAGRKSLPASPAKARRTPPKKK